ncbi:MAG: MarC family protein [Chloroflexota bacterium]
MFSEELWLSVIPLFVAIDAIGSLPFILSLLQGLPAKQQIRMINFALLTALGLGLGFVLIGQFVFSILGISNNDFLVAGGLLLLILSIRDIITGKIMDIPTSQESTVGIVPIGTPLIVGPAVLATLLLLTRSYSFIVVLSALLLNLALTWLILSQGQRVASFLGLGGQRAATKIASLLLAAIAVKMVRSGISGMFGL